MSSLTFFAVVIALCLAAASATVSFQLFRGSWLFLVVGKKANSDDPTQQEKAQKTAKRMTLVTATLALLLLTIVIYEIARSGGNKSFSQVALVINNIAFVLFIAALIAFYVMQRASGNPPSTKEIARTKDISSESARMVRRAQKAKIDVFPTATLWLLIGVAVIAFGVGFLFSLL